MEKKVRVRFAPSPTGGLHVGGVRTVLYNYLFAKQHGGDFILRIEDTDQSRYVAGAEQYIIDCLEWCGLNPDEGPHIGGPYAPYRQSERKVLYREYADKLVSQGNAYYAFDTPAELEEMRAVFKTEENPQPQYNSILRQKMSNSISMGEEEVSRLMSEGMPYVIRMKMPDNEEIIFTDMIRGEVSFRSDSVDDKVLLKADGMPTYHLAVVVDDYLMKVTHAFRGEEWLPSAPVHILLWKYLGWQSEMPQWAHLPLILKPDGHGKLSKRDGERLGFPVFAMDWKDPISGELTTGFKEKGFLREAFLNLLAMLGWNDGSSQEIFTLDELVHHFTIDRVHKAGARFDYEKAKWFNHEWIKRTPDKQISEILMSQEHYKSIQPAKAFLEKVVGMVKERCVVLNDFWEQSSFFFEPPAAYDNASIKNKWNQEKKDFFQEFSESIESLDDFEPPAIEDCFKNLATKANIKPGELLLPFRIMLVGGKFGPQVFEIAATIGKEQTKKRIAVALLQF
ncbi:MAG: glutamate--tRNA ligase [Chitinophagaceae bacterium]